MTEIEIDGLDDTIRFLSHLPAAAERAAEEGAQDAAGNEVPRIRARAGQVGRQQALAARSVRTSPDGIVAGAGGGVPAAIFYGAEFGGGGEPRTRQFDPHRGTAGYFLFPQIRDDESMIIEQVAEAFDPILTEWDRDR